MKKWFLILTVLLFSGAVSFSQCTATGSGLSAAATPTAASCPLNGSIAIAVTGSSAGGPYTFILSGPCLSSPLNQSQPSPNYTFNSLQGNCTYTVCISDAGGNIISKSVTVGNNYTAFAGVVLTDSMYTSVACSNLAADVTGGRAPYSYELFLGVTAAGSPVQGPQSSRVFTGISPATQYTIRVTDACGQSIIATKSTGNLAPQSMQLYGEALESCSIIREQIALNNSYTGIVFSDNNSFNAYFARLKLPVIISARNNAGQLISGYPYTINAGLPAPWGESANAALEPFYRWSPPIPNNPAIFPVTFTYTAGCSATASAVVQYNSEFAKAAYAVAGASYPDTSQCPEKKCFMLSVQGDYVAGNNYPISVYTNPAGTGTPVRIINYPSEKIMCGLDALTTYYFKVHDPCLNKDTITSKRTDAAPGPFTVTPVECYQYCHDSVNAVFNYTGAAPVNVIADAGPAAAGPYPRNISFSVFPSNILLTLSAGNYHFVFRTRCGESASAAFAAAAGSLFASPVHSVSTTGCVSAAVTITPHISATGQMLTYHSVPGCHNTSASETAYIANIIFTVPAGAAPIPSSGDVIVNNPNDGYTVNVHAQGTYVASVFFAEGSPGTNNPVSGCYENIMDTFVVSFNTIPTVIRIYTLPCAGNSYSLVPIAPNALPGTLYTLYAANGTTVLAGPQTSNVFPNISTALGNGLIIKAQDPCGQSGSVPVSLNTSTTISGSVNCFSYNNGGVPASADSLKADFINGATYLWKAPDGTTFSGANPPPVFPGQAGVWTLTTTLQNGLCSSVLTNSFTTTLCAQGGQPNPNDPRTDTIHLDGAADLCKTILTWTTQTEINSLNFYVEESNDNNVWVRVAVVAAAGTSSTPRVYSYIIDPSAKHKFYRIRQTDTDGRIKYSNTIELNTDCTSGTDVLTTDTNPVDNGVFTFELPTSVARGNAYIILVDAIGREYFRRPVIINRGINIYQFRPQQILSKGTYFVRVISGDGAWRSNTVKVLFIK